MLRFRFPIVIIDEDFRSENTSGLGIRALAQAIEKEGFEVLGATSYGDLSSFAQQQSRASAFILSIDDEEFTPGPELDPAVLNLRKFIEEIRFKNADIPIYLYGETRTSQHLPNDVLRELHGFIHMFEDTPEFVARHIIREAKSYLDGLAPPFFKALMDYAQDGSYSWHCPGHSGGVAFLKSPVGQMFHQFFGENMLRADVCNSVEELGQLLDHTGPVAQSERNAARIFNADHCFFVTNGTSTSNKMVWHNTVAPGDVVVVDRNCHKSILHAIIMTGAVPVFLRPTRNHYGIIGPIPESEFTPRGDPEEDRRQPAAEGRGREEGQAAHPDADAEHLRRRALQHRDHQARARRLHRHPAFRRGLAAARGLPQVLRQLPRDGQEPPAPERPARLRHAVHPQAAGRHQPGEPGAGARFADPQARPAPLQRGLPDAHLHQPAVRDHRELRRGGGDDGGAGRPRAGGRKHQRGDGLPPRDAQGREGLRQEGLVVQGLGPDKIAAEGIGKSSDWILKANEKWHGFGPLAEGFNLLDPIKSTLITPGLDVSGKFAATGIPASIVTKFLAEHGVVVEKTGLYSIFIMFTIGITKGRWNTLLTALQQFKDDYDRNVPMWRILPEFVAVHPRYERVGLRDLSQSIHQMYAKGDIARLTTEMYLSNLDPAMKPSDAYAHIAHRQTERVEIDALEGRITTSLLTPYPPGIPLLIPGERFNRKIVDYLRFTREFNSAFPGFDTDVHGLVEQEGEDGVRRYYVDCVAPAA
jgi:arginine decarboxylase